MLGLHLSLESDISQVVKNAKMYNTDTFQIFIRNNRNLRQRTYTTRDIDRFNAEIFKSDITTFVIHAPYAMNLCRYDSKVEGILKHDRQLMDLFACKHYMVVHPGSSMGSSAAIDYLSDTLSDIDYTNSATVVCVEFMAGAGTQVLSNYEQIDHLIERKPDVRFCFDTCHVFAAGMSVRDTFDKYYDRIDVLHVNDSEGIFGSHLDRHANIGKGKIPIGDIEYCISNFPKDKPIILETPSAGAINDLLIANKML